MPHGQAHGPRSRAKKQATKKTIEAPKRTTPKVSSMLKFFTEPFQKPKTPKRKK